MFRSRALWCFCVFFVLGRLGSAASAQAPTTPVFEVASVKQNKSGPDSLQRVAMQPGDRVTITNVTLWTLIQVAYPGMSEIIGGPKWIGSAGPSVDADRFDVNAKAEAPASREQLQFMLRALLADRFKLVVHTESKAEPIWALVAGRRDGKLGPNLRPATAGCAALRANAQAGGRSPCGDLGAMASVTGKMSVRGMGLDLLAGVLSREAGRKVVDKTELSGNFDWDLAFTPQRFLERSFDRDRFPSIDPSGPSVFTAVQEQLGLKLESQKGEVAVLVIEHVEHPTGN